jgi:hypothetical protein
LSCLAIIDPDTLPPPYQCRPYFKCRIPIYQSDIDEIFPTRPSLKIFDFTSHMMNRYVDALLRLLRLDAMGRGDAFALAMQLRAVAGQRPGSVGSRGGTAVPASRGGGGGRGGAVSFAAGGAPSLDELFMCSLLPDGRQTRIDFADAVIPQRSLVAQKRKRAGSAPGVVDHFPERVDVNADPGAGAGAGVGGRRVLAGSGPHGFAKPPSPPVALDAHPPGPGPARASSLPEIKKKHSILTIDVNHGTGLFVPLQRTASAELSAATTVPAPAPVPFPVRVPAPPPPRAPAGAPSGARPGSGARSVRSGAGPASEADPLAPASILRLVDATALLAERLSSPEHLQVKSPRQNIMFGTAAEERKKKSKSKKGRKRLQADPAARLTPTAGNIARTLRDAVKARGRPYPRPRGSSTSGCEGALSGGEGGDRDRGRDSSPERAGAGAGAGADIALEAEDHGVDDVILVLNVRAEGSEARLLLGGINCQHDALWDSFL